MNKLFTLLVFLLLNGFFIGNSFAGQDTCLKNADDEIITVSGNSATPVGSLSQSASDQCSDTPDEYQLSFHMMALCTSDPSLLDYSSCEYMLEPIAGRADVIPHTIRFPSTGSLDIPAFTIAPGTYNYMVAIISNKLGIKHTIKTSNTTTGASSSDGKACWTSNAGPSGISNDEADTPHGATVEGGTQMLTCGAIADAAPVFSYEIINVMSDGTNCSGTYAANGDRGNMGVVGNGTAYASLLQTNSAFATDCEDADRILWTISLTTPLVVGPASAFEFNMRTADSVSVDFSNSSDTNIIKMGADPIQTFLNVINP